MLLLVPFFSGGNPAAPAESMVSAVWINKERRSSVSREEAAFDEGRMLDEADRSCLQAAESPWHTHLEMHLSVQAFHQENIQVKPTGQLVGSDRMLPLEEDQHLLENYQKTHQGASIPEPPCQVGSTKTKEESSLKTSIQCPSAIKNPHRPTKPAHYPFPQRKAPRISQAARNLGLYGPA